MRRLGNGHPCRSGDFRDMEMGGMSNQIDMMQSKPFYQRDNYYGVRDMEIGGTSYETNMRPELYSQGNFPRAMNLPMNREVMMQKREFVNARKDFSDIGYGSSMEQNFYRPSNDRRYQRHNQDFNNSNNSNNYRQGKRQNANDLKQSSSQKRSNYFKNHTWVSDDYRKPEPVQNDNPSKTKKKQPRASSAQKRKIPKRFLQAYEPIQILTADEEPTKQMTARMEYCLGIILKEIKAKHQPDPVVTGCLQIPFIERIVKSVIRDRITKVMMNKPIDNYATILVNYRKHYPLNKEVEILKILKDDQEVEECPNDNFVQIEEPKKFFRINMMRLLERKVFEVITGLAKPCNNKKQISDLLDELPDVGDVNESDLVTETDQTETFEEANEETNEDPEKAAKLKKYIQLMDLLIAERLPCILWDHRYNIVRMLSEKDFKALQSDIMLETKHLIARNAKFQESESKSSNIDRKAGTKVSTGDAAVENTKTVNDATENTGTVNAWGATVVKEENTEGSYYVKLHGSPSLPPKLDLYTYLNKFNPASIQDNADKELIVVGFNDIKQYENILKDNEIKIGNITIILSPSQASDSSNNETAYQNNLLPVITDGAVSNEHMKCDMDGMDVEQVTNEQDANEVNTQGVCIQSSDNVQDVQVIRTKDGSVNKAPNTTVRTSALRTSTRPGNVNTGK